MKETLYMQYMLNRVISYKTLLNALDKDVNRTGICRGFLKSEIKKRMKGQPSVFMDDGVIQEYVYEWGCDAVHYGALPLDCLTDWLIMKVGSIKQIFRNDLDI